MEKTHKFKDAEELKQGVTPEQYEKWMESTNFKSLKEIILTFIASKQPEKATEEIVKYIQKNHIIKSIRQDEKKEMWIYEDGIYIENAISYIQEISRQLLGTVFTTYLCNNVTAKIEADTYIEQKEFFNQQNEYPYLIPVQNGILDIKTKELKEYNPKYYFFNKLNVDYKPGVDCPHFKKFLSEITENDNDREGLKEMFGYSMLKEYKFEKAFMLHGEKGRNGKSKLLSVLRELLGVKNCAEQSLQKLEEDNFNLVELHNKLVNISADISKAAMNNTGNFKALTGRDTINAQRKFKTGLQFTNYAKMIFACNDLPFINKNENAVWLRWVYIPFPYQFLPLKEMELLTEEEKKHTKLQDPEIIKQLTTPEEFSGILNWALEGFYQLQKNKDFSNAKSSNVLKQLWMKKSSSALSFCLDNVQEDFDSYILQKDFRRKYIDYCKKYKLNSLSNKAIKVILESEYGASEGQKRIIDKDGYEDRPKVWNGVSLISRNNLVNYVNQVNHDSDPIAKMEFSPRVENVVDTVDTVDTKKHNSYTHLINCMLVGEKYTQNTLSLVSGINKKNIEELLEKMILAGDLMIIDDKYMLVER